MNNQNYQLPPPEQLPSDEQSKTENANRDNAQHNEQHQSGNVTHDYDCELLVIGTLLNNQSVWNDNAELLSDSLFFDDKHKKAFKAAKVCLSKGDTVDVVNVNAEILKHPQQYEGVTRNDLDKMSSQVLRGSEIRTKLERLQELSLRRNLWIIGKRLENAGLNESKPVEKAQDEALRSLQDLFTTPSSNIKSMKEVGEAFRIEVLEANRNGNRNVCVPTGFKVLDEKGAFQLSDLWTIGADTSQGKTSFAEAIAIHATTQGVPTVIYSMEMTSKQLYARIMSSRIGVPNEIIYTRPLTDEQYQRALKANERLEMLPAYFEERSTNTPDEIFSSIRTMYYKKNIKLAIVDYLQILNVNTKSINEEQALANAARHFKNLAKELNICIILLSQLNKDQDGNRYKPKITRLRGSGQIAEASDGVILLWRPEYYTKNYGNNLNFPKPFEDVSIHGTALIEVAKGRNIGRTSFIAGFDSKLTKFYDLNQSMLPKRSEEPKSMDEGTDDPF